MGHGRAAWSRLVAPDKAPAGPLGYRPRMSRSRLLWLTAALAFACCAPTVAVDPNEGVDAGAVEAPDAGRSLDAGAASDAGPEFDAGATADAGSVDAGPEVDGGLTLDAGPVTPDAGPVDAGPPPIDGIVFVHGVNGSANDWAPTLDHFKQDGFPAARLVAHTFADPSWGCNATANEAQVATWVKELETLGAHRIALVAHSMGGLSSRAFLKNGGGTARVDTFITLGTMHHGLASACLNPLPVCVWQEICGTGPFLTALNAAPATPGPTRWVSLYSDADQTVPATSSFLAGAENYQFHGLAHSGANSLLTAPEVYLKLKDELR